MSHKRLGIEDLIALNDELAGLMRAGVPLDMGLRGLADGSSSGVARVSQRLMERVTAGASLEKALRDEGSHLPGIYVATVEAGMRTGRLPEALEMLSQVARELLELHRRAVTAILYPACVVVLSYVLTLIYVGAWVPMFVQTFSFKPLELGTMSFVLMKLHDTLPYWGPALPVIVIASLYLCGSWGQDNSGVGSLTSSSLRRFAWLPWMWNPIRNFDRCLFAKLMSLLIRHETSLPDALLLASYATGSLGLITASQEVAESVRGGAQLADSVPRAAGFPPFLRTMLTLGERHHTLAATLDRTSDVYQQQAEDQVEFARTALPIVLTVVFGGLATAAYGFVIFGPMADLYMQVGHPMGAP